MRLLVLFACSLQHKASEQPFLVQKQLPNLVAQRRARPSTLTDLVCASSPHSHLALTSHTPLTTTTQQPTRRLRTRFIEGSHNPVWDERHEVYLADEAETFKLTIKVLIRVVLLVCVCVGVGVGDRKQRVRQGACTGTGPTQG